MVLVQLQLFVVVLVQQQDLVLVKELLKFIVCLLVNGILIFFYSTDNGTTKRLILEKPTPYTVPSSTVACYRFEVPELVGLVLPGGNTHQLSVSTHNAEAWNILIESGLL
jgi:hypothetical protein